MPRVLDASPPPTSLPSLSPDEGQAMARAGTEQAVSNLPGASIASAVRQSQQIGMQIAPALRAGDYKGAASAFVQSTAAALSAIPGVHMLPMFGGIVAGMNAATADKAALAAAQKLEQAGASQENIWRQTGWFKGPEDKWKFEIDDSKMSFSRTAEQGGFTIKADNVGRAVDHPELLAAYPDLAGVKVAEGGAAGKGGYRPAADSSAKELITVGPASDARERSTMLHELQHAVQEREGFARGSNPQIAVAENPEEYQRMLDAAKGDDGPQGWGSVGTVSPGQAGPMAADALYRRSAGEAEARAVQRRADMTPEERRIGSPLLSYDMPLDKLLFSGAAPPPPPTAADRARDGLSILAHPEAWGAK